MRKSLAIVFAVAVAGSAAVPATAATGGPDIPKIPQDCHEWNDFFGIDNVQSCDGNHG